MLRGIWIFALVAATVAAAATSSSQTEPSKSESARLLMSLATSLRQTPIRRTAGCLRSGRLCDAMQTGRLLSRPTKVFPAGEPMTSCFVLHLGVSEPFWISPRLSALLRGFRQTFRRQQWTRQGMYMRSPASAASVAS